MIEPQAKSLLNLTMSLHHMTTTGQTLNKLVGEMVDGFGNYTRLFSYSKEANKEFTRVRFSDIVKEFRYAVSVFSLAVYRTLKKTIPIIAVFNLILLSGCSAIGPVVIKTDRFDYNNSIYGTRNEELLLNLVRVRYGEPPLFMDVAQVLTQYTQEGSARAGVDTGFEAGSGTAGTNSIGLGVSGVWEERPTITYLPRTGSKFAQSLLTPIDPVKTIKLSHGGWSTKQVLRRTLRSINGISVRTSESGDWNPEYAKMMEALSHCIEKGAIGISDSSGEEGIPVLRFRQNGIDEESKAYLEILRELWGIGPDLDEFKMVTGAIPDNPNEISILSSSILDLLRDYAAYIEVPPSHVEKGWTKPTVEPPADEAFGRAPISVKAAKDQPDDTFVKVFTHETWFSIPMSDLHSKRMFSLLIVFLQLAESGTQADTPQLSVSAGS